MLLNEDTEVMRQAFSRMMLFLTFIKGPNVQEWVGAQVGWLGRHILAGARKTDQHLYCYETTRGLLLYGYDSR